MITKKRLLPILLSVIVTLVIGVQSASAYSISEVAVEPKNDFVLEPGKTEIILNPGETITKNIYITNRIPGTTKFSVDVEDIQGTNNADKPVVILDEGEPGPNSGRNYISPDTKEFSLQFGQRITIPVTITLPENAAPGGLYSSVLVSNEPSVLSSTSTSQGFAKVISRLGTLFFIRVAGDANEQANLEDFRVKGGSKLPFIPLYEKGPFTFEVLFNNTGNVHLVPYGNVTITNTFGKQIADLPIDAYFSLPNALRYREIIWDKPMLFGRYTATLTMNRGYDDLVDTKKIVLWIIPWKIVLGLFAAIFVVVLLAILFFRTFEFKKKSR